jgi:hypothetical protein
MFSLVAVFLGNMTNFSAGNSRRKWPCDELPRPPRAAMVTALAALAVFCALAPPAKAARKSSQSVSGRDIFGDLFGGGRVRLRRPVHQARVPPHQAPVPLPRPRPAEAEKQVKPVEPEKPAVANVPPTEPEKPAAPAAPQPSACRQALTEEIAIAPSIPDIHGTGGCGGEDLVRLEAIVLPDRKRVSVKPPATLRCPMASAIADWVRTDIVPLAAQLGSEPSGLDILGSYECRGFNGVPGAPLSEHGHANALDVGAIKLANGQEIVLTDRTVARALRESVLHSVCARFMTVLGPDSDWYHEEHIHLDLMPRHNNYKICQWDVLDPLPKVAPLLPAERPVEAPPRKIARKDTDKDADKDDAHKSSAEKPAAAKSDPAEPAAEESKPATTAPQTKKSATKKRR